VDSEQLLLSCSTFKMFSEEDFLRAATTDRETQPELQKTMQAITASAMYVEPVSQDARSSQNPKPMSLGEDDRIRTGWEVQLLSEAERQLIKRSRNAVSPITIRLVKHARRRNRKTIEGK
jgi:hypothetical protein